ncbi:hypothetical protein FCM35_KLT10164 [Carex littledalei]|uniref:DUF7915 domain-containing protein n=1 Tax=Carex littledalei TaxID=544730 RepID=A0A833R9S7_9POAL|nr:hypothetical protein FCM35_KLT10164 [Carex littledalei]
MGKTPTKICSLHKQSSDIFPQQRKVKGDGFVDGMLKAANCHLKGPVLTSGSIPELTAVVRFFLLLPYADIISDWLSKPKSELEKELEKREGKPTQSNKTPMKINNEQVQNMTSLAWRPSNNCSLNNCLSELSGIGTLRSVKLGAEVGNNSGENGTAKEITKDVKQENGNTSKELMTVNSKPCTRTKRAIIETYVKQEIVPFAMKDIPSCVSRLMKIRDHLCENQRKLEDKVAQCEMDIETVRCEGEMTSEVEKIVERWENAISSEGQLDASDGCLNPNKKKKFKRRSSCQVKT